MNTNRDVFDFLDQHRDRVSIGGKKHAARAVYPGERIKSTTVNEWSVAIIGDDSTVMEVLPLSEFRTRFM